MAKKDKKDKAAKKAKKAAEKAKAQFVGAAIESKGLDVAHKIWLAGVGAYGKAYDVAADGVGKVSGQSGVLFDDLVKRGEEIEGDVRARLSSNTAVSKMTEQMSKVAEQASKVAEQASKVRGRVAEATEDATEAVTKFQEEQRERLEARMERMREALGLKKFSLKAKKAEKLHSKLDDLEEQVAELKADATGADDKVKARVERLSAEIADVGGKRKKAKKAAPKAKKVKAAPKAEAKLPMADENGRLEAPIGTADDLKMIKGVGAVLEGKLNQAGIFHFWQIASLKKAQVELLETDMSFPGRIGRDEWVAQAKTFAKEVAA